MRKLAHKSTTSTTLHPEITSERIEEQNSAHDAQAPANPAEVGSVPTNSQALTQLEHAILELEQRFGHGRTAAKLGAIRDLLDMSEIKYFQALNLLCDHHAALAAYPVMVSRMRRLRTRRLRKLR